MKITLHTKKLTARKKTHADFNARRYWVILLCFFVLALTAELAYFTWVFWDTNKRIDAPATLILETNAAKIRTMEKTLGKVEEAIAKRNPGVDSTASEMVSE